MLKELAIITITVANLGQVGQAWQDKLDYRAIDNGAVSSELSELWGAPAMAGKQYIVMAPANSAQTFIRFVQDDTAANYQPMTSHGWNATELLVRDTDAVAAQLRESKFEIVGEPKNLWPAPDAPRAMQAKGAGNELLYLTTNSQAAGALGLDDRMPLVERAFIMVLGGKSMDDFAAFYGDKLGLKVDPPSEFKITMISKANDLDIDTTYPLSIVHLAPGYLLELDEMPDTIGAREVAAGHLPPGVAVVGAYAVNLAPDLDWVSEPRAIEEFPYNGREAGILRGPAGELIEVIEPEAGDWALWPGME